MVRVRPSRFRHLVVSVDGLPSPLSGGAVLLAGFRGKDIIERTRNASRIQRSDDCATVIKRRLAPTRLVTTESAGRPAHVVRESLLLNSPLCSKFSNAVHWLALVPSWLVTNSRLSNKDALSQHITLSHVNLHFGFLWKP